MPMPLLSVCAAHLISVRIEARDFLGTQGVSVHAIHGGDAVAITTSTEVILEHMSGV